MLGILRWEIGGWCRTLAVGAAPADRAPARGEHASELRTAWLHGAADLDAIGSLSRHGMGTSLDSQPPWQASGPELQVLQERRPAGPSHGRGHGVVECR